MAVTTFIMANATAQPMPEASPFQLPFTIFIVFAIFYVAAIRPQHRREKERKELLNNIQSGNRVLLTSGIIGQVTNIKEQTLVIRIAENTKIETVRSAVAQVLEKDEAPADTELSR